MKVDWKDRKTKRAALIASLAIVPMALVGAAFAATPSPASQPVPPANPVLAGFTQQSKSFDHGVDPGLPIAGLLLVGSAAAAGGVLYYVQKSS